MQHLFTQRATSVFTTPFLARGTFSAHRHLAITTNTIYDIVAKQLFKLLANIFQTSQMHTYGIAVVERYQINRPDYGLYDLMHD